MIKFYEQVPSVYNNASRDFQYLSWLINIVLNSVKHNVDDMYKLPNVAIDPGIAELFALTLGFKIKRNYDQKQLTALAAILPSILRYKGTLKAVEMAAEALIAASGASGTAKCIIDLDNPQQLNVTIPKDTAVDITLFLDLLDYILPAGMTCRVKRETRTEYELDKIYVKHKDKVYFELLEDLGWEIDNLSTGLSVLFDADLGTTDFGANFIQSADGTNRLNAGLLNNTVIPVIPGKDIGYNDSVALLSSDGKALKAYLDQNEVTLKAKKSIQEL